ncbi:GIY-YIG nuclease family protein (plasmid) [Haloarcula salina]|uniref:GIY-YIG nuclease family protein n=1 Tax=Haloarcula salina TaxID=1429914 RepID=UPI003C6EC337
MADLRQEYHDKNPNGAQSHTQDIQNELDGLIEYDVANETSLKNPFLEACFNRIGHSQSWEELVRTHESYNDSWKPQRKRATALRMLMTEQVGWPSDEGLLGFKRKYLAGILVAIKASDRGITRSEDHVQITLDPTFDLTHYSDDLPNRTHPELDLPTLMTFSDTVESDAFAVLKEQSIDPSANNHHVVYVIDCTPDADTERSAITSIREDAQAKKKSGQKLTEREAAADFLNESKCILYVGYSHEFPSRMSRHYQGKSSGSADFVNLYKPKRLMEVTDYPSESDAKKMEQIRAEQLRRETDCYVYQA